jgi:hypothetical protein
MIEQLSRAASDSPGVTKIKSCVGIGQVLARSHSSWGNLVGWARIPRRGSLVRRSCENLDAKRPLVVAYQRGGYPAVVDIAFDFAQMTLAAPDLSSELAEGNASFLACLP